MIRTCDIKTRTPHLEGHEEHALPGVLTKFAQLSLILPILGILPGHQTVAYAQIAQIASHQFEGPHKVTEDDHLIRGISHLLLDVA